MKSIDKLREYVDRQQDEYNNHNVSFVWQLSTIADEIEAEIADNYMRLPLDANNEPIHVGDVLDPPKGSEEYGRLMVTELTYDGEDWYFKGEIPASFTGQAGYFNVIGFAHVKPRTLEDVIEGAINTAFDNEASVSDIAKKSADEIREMLGIMLGGDAE